MSVGDDKVPPAAPRRTLSEETIVYLGLAFLVALGVGMTLLFGLQGLAMTALALVPVVYAVLLLITVGK